MKPFFACLILAAVLISGNAGTAGAYQVIGGGLSSCGSWTATRRDVGDGRPVTGNSQSAYGQMQWVLGFLSGIGYAGLTDPLNGMDAQGVLAWIDNYCQAHPIEQLVGAARAFDTAHPR